MARIIKGEDGVVTLRLDKAYVSNGKYLIEPYIDEGENRRWFGNFKFLDSKEARKTLKEAVKQSDFEDSVFYGNYPKWIEDSYGESLGCNNRVKFFKELRSSEQITGEEIYDHIYALEVHLKKSKEGAIYLVVARAIATGKNERSYNDELFDDFVETRTDEKPIDINEDDLPF